jgi:hypothetical protein
VRRQIIRWSGIVSAGVASAGCSDQTPTRSESRADVRVATAEPIATPLASSVSQIDPWTYARYPGRWSVGLSPGSGGGSDGAKGSYTSAIFSTPERTYLDTALVAVRIEGIRSRAYAQIDAWNNRPTPIGGQGWMPQDAAGDWINSSGCQGNVQFEGMVGGQPHGGAVFFCIRNRPFDAPRQQRLDSVGVIWGQTRVRRFGGYELNKHQFCGWNNFPDCFTYSGSQTMTVVPIARTLTVTAVPSANFYEGDSVTFTAASPHPMTIRTWQFFPEDSAQAVATFAHCGTNRICRARVPGKGLVVVRARVVPWGQLNRIETAHVRLDPLPVQLVLTASRVQVPSGDTVEFFVTSNPARPISDATWSATGASVRVASWLRSLTEEAVPISTGAGLRVSGCQPGEFLCVWTVQGAIIKRVEALVNGVAKSAQVRVDTLSCSSGDQLLDRQDFRDLLEQMWKESNPDSVSWKRRERLRFVYEDSIDGRLFFIDNPFPELESACSVRVIPPATPPAKSRLIAWIHTHPSTEGSLARCTENGPLERKAIGPSPNDRVIGSLSGMPDPRDSTGFAPWIPSPLHHERVKGYIVTPTNLYRFQNWPLSAQNTPAKRWARGPRRGCPVPQ